MKSTWFHDPGHYRFAKEVYAAGRHAEGFYKCFYAWLECAYLTLRQGVSVFRTGRKDEQDEARYLEIIRSIPKPDHFANAFAVLVEELEKKPDQDFLGSVFHAMEIADKRGRGQCFTPYSLCSVIARMTMGDLEKPVAGSDQLHINEPCMGAGAMIIACHNNLIEREFPLGSFYFIGQDIDIKCFWMSYIQLTLHGIPAFLTLGDSLAARKPEQTALTLIGAMHPFREKRKKPRPSIRRVEVLRGNASSCT